MKLIASDIWLGDDFEEKEKLFNKEVSRIEEAGLRIINVQEIHFDDGVRMFQFYVEEEKK